MQEIINTIPVLAITMIINIAVGLYYNIGVKSFNFDFGKLFVGIIKAAIVGATFIGLSYCFSQTDLSALGVTPMMIMNAAILLYVGKDLVALGKILGVEVKTK